ncbi:nuclear transport factor 2 family protein [Streptomyces sp. NPDC049040]|uniref:nuclear transport factor 2 family protein n=1 Tax=Streptomyces sp. NPDC049040 TaxID=3365593 RepID=UPI00371EA149
MDAVDVDAVPVDAVAVDAVAVGAVELDAAGLNGAGLDAVGVVEALWARVQARDWEGVGALLAEDAVVEWPITRERIVGRANYVAVNREYPQGWSIRVLRILGEGDQVVSEVEVPHVEAGLFRAASFWTVRDGLIVRGTEYWTTVGGEPSQEWRARLVEQM